MLAIKILSHRSKTTSVAFDVLVHVAATLSVLHADLTTLAVDGQGPAAAALGRGIVLASDVAGRLIKALRALELVAAVALAAVLSAGDGESKPLALGDALFIAHGANVGTTFAVESAGGIILETTGILVAADLIASTRSASRSGCSSGHGDSLVDGVYSGGLALVRGAGRRSG